MDPNGVRRLLRDPSPSARAAAVRRLAGAERPAAVAVVVTALEDPHPYVRRAAAGVLGQILDPVVRSRAAKQLLRHRSEVVRGEACRAFLLWADAVGTDALRRALEDRAAAVRVAAVVQLVELALADPESAGPFAKLVIERLEDVAAEVRAEAADALARIVAQLRQPRIVPATAWLRLARDRDARVRLAALEGSAAAHGETAMVAVLHGLGDAVWSVRLRAAELARDVRDRRVFEALVERLEDERWRVRSAAHAALISLTGIPFGPERERWLRWLGEEGRSFDPAAVDAERASAVARRQGHTVAAARFLDLTLVSRHVVFVLDASRSMSERIATGRTRWEEACTALDAALSELLEAPGQATVNVICFAADVDPVFPEARVLTPGARAAIRRWLSRRAPSGKTALFDGVAAALRDPGADSVVVLSDGAPSAGAFFTKTELVAEIGRLNRWHRARIDVVAVGSDRIAARWRDVLGRVAAENGGVLVKR